MNLESCNKINYLDINDYKKSIINVDLKHYFKNYGYENCKELKEIIRKNAKKIREIIFRNSLIKKNDTCDNTKCTIKNNIYKNKEIINTNNEKNEIFKNKIISKKKSILYKDYLYTLLIRNLYILFSSLNLEKKKEKKFDFTKVYTYEYNYKELTLNKVIDHLKNYGIIDVKLTDIKNFKFFTYCNKLKTNFNDKESNFNICIYIPTKKEVDILFIIEALYDYFYFNLYVPITTKNNDLIFFPFNIINNVLVKHNFNIFVPYLYIYLNTHNKISFNLNNLNIITNKLFNFTYKENDTIFIIPLIAYNNYGCRIGSGKGYYDKTLKKNKNITNLHKKDIKNEIKISVSFEVFLYDIDFYETTDIILDYIINEKNIYHFLF
ncbi:conserved Plasmodium protein, unknown function [Plasmodium gallinaceum]|uniref:5-formyltetrahydrofolate cyclo-ligase n=1 Tax=Plasmodium gallinaceum TaxID=5849 RepID=A0A1J1GXA0_PLAGA|nr:conserved Plasmodium protein, unknown function [Plasmodium gallinaceum]CRG97076.1 conserved Plasmodium protein, unknown function [Plasmodium gallinaceum]